MRSTPETREVAYQAGVEAAKDGLCEMQMHLVSRERFYIPADGMAFLRGWQENVTRENFNA